MLNLKSLIIKARKNEEKHQEYGNKSKIHDYIAPLFPKFQRKQLWLRFVFTPLTNHSVPKRQISGSFI